MVPDQSLKILEEEDFNTIDRATTKLWTAPLTAMAVSSLLILGYRKINLSKLLLNPFGKPKNVNYTNMDQVL